MSEVAPYSEAITETSKTVGKAIDLVRDFGQPVANAYGLVIGDRIESWRERNLDAMTRRTQDILRERELLEAAPVAEAIAIPLLKAAEGEPRAEMLELWATLLANAMDPARRNEVRKEFIAVVRDFHPTDAVVLKKMADLYRLDFVQPAALRDTDISETSVSVSLRNLYMKGCVEESNAHYKIAPFGIELVRACSS
ncbi:Abi-alpha family protein [Tardiphaga sp. 11_C7_N12_6]|uniref:Abi-alpha family protein n=1 Tax=Tardiphaga sp. 11_C7_N12_6 TaxID=3240789 RepID=UPI003F263C34